MVKHPVWFITGCSSGFGRAIVTTALARGFRVVATARKPADLENIHSFDEDKLLRAKLDVTSDVEVERAVAEAYNRFARIDVLVNNAGFGYFGAIEESEESAVRDMFEVNFWGLARVTRALLPAMRAQRAGRIINISSIGGLRGGPAVGYYNATKFAVEGWSEALAAELLPLGLKVMLVEPSGFRTDWAGRSAAEATTLIDDYAATAHARRQQIRNGSGKQAGDPLRAAAAIIDAASSENTPMRLLLGNVALEGARAKIESLTRDVETWADVTKSADFPNENTTAQ
ncbi:Short-chain dehydrogenase [Methylobacterium pseudosasicola]|uniref:Short-chain dehydrogenase n=2 Tax=Methylobacterium pseudosasicola TaxID=582667 RepID=A0A1I4LU58_9HYPH|nr:Short-chain dehydrogenase [Methylobacterium pseudosasicola]